jgi:cofilin
MSSSITVNDDVISAFNDMKLKKQYSYLIFKINEDRTKIVLESSGAPQNEGGGMGALWEKFIKSFPESEPRYGVINFVYQTDDGGPKEKIIFVSWIPDSAKQRLKMLYTSSKDALLKALYGIGLIIQVTDNSELNFQNILEQIKPKYS